MLTPVHPTASNEPALAPAGPGAGSAQARSEPGFAQALQQQTAQAGNGGAEPAVPGPQEPRGAAPQEPAAAPPEPAQAAATRSGARAAQHERQARDPAPASTKALPHATTRIRAAAAADAGGARCLGSDDPPRTHDADTAAADAAPAPPSTLPDPAPAEAPAAAPQDLLAWAAGLAQAAAAPAEPAPAHAPRSDGGLLAAALRGECAAAGAPGAIGPGSSRLTAAQGDAAGWSEVAAAAAPTASDSGTGVAGARAAAAAAATGDAPTTPRAGGPAAALPVEAAPHSASARSDAATLAALAGLPQPASAVAPAPGEAAAAPVQADIAEAVGTEPFAPALASRLSVLVREGVEHAQLRLNPVEMGPIEVRIRIDGVHTQVDFSAAQAHTRQALQEAVPALAGALREAGLTLTGGGVFDQPREPRGETAPRDARHSQTSRDCTAGEAATAATAPRPSRARGVLDLYA